MRLPRDQLTAGAPPVAAPPLQAELPADRSAAVTQLFTIHYAQLVRMARLLVDDQETAEDVVMEAFTSLHQRWRAIREPHEAYRYVRSCVLNGARSRLRRRRLSRRYEGASTTIGAVAGDHDPAVLGTDRAVVVQLLRTLPVRQRQVLVLRYFVDLSEREIAEAMGIGAGSVKTHASRGLAALAKALEDSR